MTRRGGNAHYVADPGNSFGGSYNRLSLEPKRELCPANDLGLTRLVDGKPDLAPEWHSSQDLCSAFVAAVVHVNELAARERNALAHLHERLAPWALGVWASSCDLALSWAVTICAPWPLMRL